jgi:hypothetical protein
MYRGLLVAAIQIALVLSLGGKLLYDRVTRPRVWVLCQVYDPELPIRGRYLSEQLRMPNEGFTYKETKKPYSDEWYMNRQWAHLEVRDRQLIAEQQGSGPGEWIHLHKNNDSRSDRGTRSRLHSRSRRDPEPEGRPRDVG